MSDSILNILLSEDDDLRRRMLIAERLIAEAKERLENPPDKQEPEEEFDWFAPGGYYDVAPVSDSNSKEASDVATAYDDSWLLEGKPEGTVLPPASGRETVRTPNLNSANPSFAARLILYVRDRFGGDTPSIYRAAHISRKTYSAIISNELRPVSKQVAVAFAFALKLSLDEAKELLRSAGHAFSDFMLEDIIYQACLIAGIYDINRVNKILTAHSAKPLSCQDEQSRCLQGGDNLQDLQSEAEIPF